MYKKLISFESAEESKIIIRLKDNASIPFDIGNVDFQEFLEWMWVGDNIPEGASEQWVDETLKKYGLEQGEQGNEPLPADEPPIAG